MRPIIRFQFTIEIYQEHKLYKDESKTDIHPEIMNVVTAVLADFTF